MRIQTSLSLASTFHLHARMQILVSALKTGVELWLSVACGHSKIAHERKCRDVSIGLPQNVKLILILDAVLSAESSALVCCQVRYRLLSVDPGRNS